MLNKVELGSVNNKRIAPYNKVGMTKRDNQSFTGLGNLALRGIQKCEESPMVNVAVLDLSTAIIPRTFFETFIGSKKKEKGKRRGISSEIGMKINCKSLLSFSINKLNSLIINKVY